MKKMKKLGFGLMRLPLLDKNNSADIDIETLKEMVDIFMKRGFTYFDTAWMYNSFESENAIRKALVERYPRDSYTLATKLHSSFFKTVEEREEMFNEQLKKTGAGYFDYYLIHSIDASSIIKYEELDCFEWLKQKKSAGLVHHMGFSFHDKADLLDKVLTSHPEMEFVQLQINYLDWENEEVQSHACYEVAMKHGKQVVIMEPVKGGTLAKLPPEAEKMFAEREPDMSPSSWAVRFAASLPGVMMVLSGMSTPEQVDDNTNYMQEFKPLTDEEIEMCHRAAKIVKEAATIPCTACSYCTDGCPMNIAISQYFSLYNEEMQDKMYNIGWKDNGPKYLELNENFAKASACIECGNCESVCPQHIKIIDELKNIAEHYE